MPQRFLKPGITSSERFNACSWPTQSFYVRLLTLVDDFGRFEGNCKLLRSLAFPICEEVTSQNVETMMAELHLNGLVVFYKANGKPYLQVTNWTERARSDDSKFPQLDNTCEQMFANANKSCGILPSSSSSSSSSSPPPIVSGEGSKSCQQLSETQLRLARLFHRRETTPWSEKERKAFRAIGEIQNEDLELLERYYAMQFPKDKDYRRRDLCTLLNNFQGELDRARKYNGNTSITMSLERKIAREQLSLSERLIGGAQ